MSQADVDQLARWRTLGARHSEEVLDLAPRVLASGRLSEAEQWSVREQLATAAIDFGKIRVATEQIRLLESKFRTSPRVDILLGLRLEAQGEIDKARKLYEGLLKDDETNIVGITQLLLSWSHSLSAHRRLIAISTNKLPNLVKYLDTFHADPEGWSLLADLYAAEGAYAQSLTALGQLMLLQTWDSQAVERAGETAYTSGDYQLALKYFLRSIEMETAPPPEGDLVPRTTRAWWGVKGCCERLLANPNLSTSVPEKDVTSPEKLRQLDVLAAKQILKPEGRSLRLRRQALGEAQAAK